MKARVTQFAGLIWLLFAFSSVHGEEGEEQIQEEQIEEQILEEQGRLKASARRACLENVRALVATVGPSYRTRDVYWSGEIKAGEFRYVPVFLFEGADCYFVLGADRIAARSYLIPYGVNRLPVAAKTIQGKEATMVKLKAEETGYYLLKIGVRPEEDTNDSPIRFALTYLYH